MPWTEESKTITRASEEWWSRPDEQRFLSLDDLYTATFTRAHQKEGEARTVWEVVNGGTAFARSIPHNDDRVILEKRVSGLLKAA